MTTVIDHVMVLFNYYDARHFVYGISTTGGLIQEKAEFSCCLTVLCLLTCSSQEKKQYGGFTFGKYKLLSIVFNVCFARHFDTRTDKITV